MDGKWFAPRGLCFLLGRALSARVLRCLGPLLERALLLAFDNGWWRWQWRRNWRTSLALLALCDREKLGNALVETSELLEKLCELPTKRGILLSQRVQLVHERVQITLGDLCRSSCLLFRVEGGGTSHAVQR